MLDFSTFYARTRSSATLRRAQRQSAAVNRLGKEVGALSDDELREKFQALGATSAKSTLALGMAIAREAIRRETDLWLHDVQVLGGLILHEGNLAEMKTGEGKTLTIVGPAALLALHGRGVHIVTANEYLATRDATRLSPIYRRLGLRVEALTESMEASERAAAYQADITYGTGAEFGFDYLRDNLVLRPEARVQRSRVYAIVDEVDSVLIDDARTPLLIAGQGEDIADAVHVAGKTAAELVLGVDVLVDQKSGSALLTEAGYSRAEVALGKSGHIEASAQLYRLEHLPLVRRLHSAVKARFLFRKNRDYLVLNGEVVLIDQGTGRVMEGRRLEEGLHEALEDLEGIPVRPSTLTRATITCQAYFGLYEQLSGLSGTAMTDAEEFQELYGLRTVVVPTNRPIARTSSPDVVFETRASKFAAAVDLVLANRRESPDQPILLGCASVRDADALSRLLGTADVPHEVLTARDQAKEAEVISRAGRPGAVTVATNMAGRGTDIILGGEDPQGANEPAATRVRAAGGLLVVGTERNAVRRVDHQLEGRSGRQGDPGHVRFMLSLEDDLLTPFRENSLLAGLRRGLQAGGALSGKSVTALVALAQAQGQSRGFEARKALLRMDSALGHQRQIHYARRDELLSANDPSAVQRSRLELALVDFAQREIPDITEEGLFDSAEFARQVRTVLALKAPIQGWLRKADGDGKAVRAELVKLALSSFDEKAKALEAAVLRALILGVLDRAWSTHLEAMKELSDGMSLRSQPGQTGDPLFQAQREAFGLFQHFLLAGELEGFSVLQGYGQPEASAPVKSAATLATQVVAAELRYRWVGRNERCPCGSGLRFKSCHGALVGPRAATV